MTAVLQRVQGGQVGLEALVGHLAPGDAALQGAVEQGAEALEAAVARLGQDNLNLPADGQARTLLLGYPEQSIGWGFALQCTPALLPRMAIRQRCGCAVVASMHAALGGRGPETPPYTSRL